MLATDEQEPIKTLTSHCSHPAFGVRVCSGRTHWGLYDPHAFGEEHLVKAGGELRVSVADQEVEPLTLLSEITGQVPSDLGHPRAAWVRAHAEEMDSSAPELDHEEHVEPVEPVAQSDLGPRNGEMLPPGWP